MLKIKEFINKRIVKNIPNMITISRIVASVAGAVAFLSGNISMATKLYIYGAVSDYFDGLAARKLNAFSEFGRKLDALSDKLYAGSLLIPSILCGNLLMLIPLAMELKIAQVNLKSQKLGFKPETQRVGKFKTFMLFPTMIVGLVSTISIEFLPLLWLLLRYTTDLQDKSIIAYENLLNYNIRKREGIEQENVELIENTDKDKGLEEVKSDTKEKKDSNKYSYKHSNHKKMNLAAELAFYVMTPYYRLDELESYKKSGKVKRRVI